MSEPTIRTADGTVMTYRQAALFQLIQSLDDKDTNKLTLVCRGTDPWNVGLSLEPSSLDLTRGNLTKEHRWVSEQHPLDMWDHLVTIAENDELPDSANSYRLKYHGLFSLGPRFDSFMLRIKIPGNTITARQLGGMAEIASTWGGGFADLTARGNMQIRDIRPRSIVNVLNQLVEVGLTSKGAGGDNIRNITASPISGLDPLEMIDVRPYAKQLHHYILNHRELFGLPRKFNIAFDNGGQMSVAASTNDIGVVPVRVGEDAAIAGLGGASPRVAFRILLAGVPGHGSLARDAGILVAPDDIVKTVIAMIRVYDEHGDRTNRRRARLKYLVEDWGLERFLEATAKVLGKPLCSYPAALCELPRRSKTVSHIGIHPQKQADKYYIGIAIPVGRLSVSQLVGLAKLAEIFGSGEVMLTIWQNLILPNIHSTDLPTVLKQLGDMGLHFETSLVSSFLLACTGASGCNKGLTHTKKHSMMLAERVEKVVKLDQPLSIHVSGCRNSCTKHKCADIGLLGTHASVAGNTVESYQVLVGGDMDDEDSGLGRDLYTNVPYHQIPKLVERMLTIYQATRVEQETFHAFVGRQSIPALRELFGDAIELPPESTDKAAAASKVHQDSG